MFNFRVLTTFLFFIFVFHPSDALSKPAIEVVPIAVWQGRQQELLSLSLLDNLRKEWSDPRVAHAVSAAPLVRSESSRQLFSDQLASIIKPGDDILLHMAPWKSIADKASVPFKYSTSLFGVPLSEANCAFDCGLDMTFTVYSSAEVRSMIALSRKFLTDQGMGAPAAVYFDEGVTSDELYKAASQEGRLQDWSGIEMGQMKSSFARFPVYQMNRDHTVRLPLDDLARDQVDGLVLDHVRYGIHAEIADLESSNRIFQAAVEHAKKVNRVVRIPIIFNMDDLYYTHEFVRDAVLKARSTATLGGVEVVAWVAKNSTWTVGKGKAASAIVPIAMAATFVDDGVAEPEFIPQDEAELAMSVEMDALAH
jgi:hypothetical protein